MMLRNVLMQTSRTAQYLTKSCQSALPAFSSSYSTGTGSPVSSTTRWERIGQEGAGSGWTGGLAAVEGEGEVDWASQARHGPGGRSSVSGVVATVFGASGFVGRYVVNRLGRAGSLVVIPHRGQESSVRHLKVMGDLGQIVLFPNFDPTDPEVIYETVKKSNVVVNLIGAPWDTKNYTMEQTNVHIPQLIAAVSREAGVRKFVHVSALGVGGPGRFLASKAAGEEAVRAEFPGAVVVRPGAVFGAEDRLFARWGGVLRHWPILPVFESTLDKQFSPVNVSDLASAISNIVFKNFPAKTYEIGGPTITLDDFVRLVEQTVMISKFRVPIPKVISDVWLEAMRFFRNPKFSVEEVGLLRQNIVPSGEHPGLAELDIKPSDIRQLAVQYVRHMRKPNFINT